MLNEPDLPEEILRDLLKAEYAMPEVRIQFLPLGVDVQAAAYRIETPEGGTFFLKLRRSGFNETSIKLCWFLSKQGIQQVIPPLETRNGKLWTTTGTITITLFPFVQARNGYEIALTAGNWATFGQALKRIHATRPPSGLADSLRREDFTPVGREMVRTILAGGIKQSQNDLLSGELVEFLRNQAALILDLVGRAEELANRLRQDPPEDVLCHSDLHAGNILVNEDGDLYIIDWDEAILAPKERDLMYPGGGQGFRGYSPQEERAHFYQGYGSVSINETALAYYRYERIVQDIAAFCEQILCSHASAEDRKQAFRYLVSNFLSGQTIEIAYRSAKSSR